MSKSFTPQRRLTDMGKNILRKRYYSGEEHKWKHVADRVIKAICRSWNEEDNATMYDMLYHRYFVPNSPTLVNAGKGRHAGLSACFVVPFDDTIDDIYYTKYNFARIARKGGGCGTTLSNIRPKNSLVNGSTHGFSGGGIDFANTISHDMDAITQSGFRSMALMFTMNVRHPDIMDFITAKTVEGKIANANMSVMADDDFMIAVRDDETYWTEFTIMRDGEEPEYKKYQELRARDVFNAVVEGSWQNGEPAFLFTDTINDTSPYRHAGVRIEATNPCVVGGTLVRTVLGEVPIEDLVGYDVDVYCKADDGSLTISTARNIRKTRDSASLVRLVTSRGDLICTPDHPIYTKNRGYVYAKDICKKDKIVGINQKMHGERYSAIGLSGTGKYEKEHRFIARHYKDIDGMDVHHIDGNTLNNVLSNLEVIPHSRHSSISNIGHENWNEKRNSLGQFIKKKSLKKKQQLKLGKNPVGTNLRVSHVEWLEYTEDVYDMEVDYYHNFIANDIIVHNCGEQPLPPYGSCNLGALDLSKFFRRGKFDWELFEIAIRYSVRFLDSVIDVNEFPIQEIEDVALACRQIGLGIMGLSDYYLVRKMAYGSPEAIEALYEIGKFLLKISYDESEKMGKELGIPEWCQKLPEPRRNMTVLTIAPTGTTALIAGCNSGIEPFFSEITQRKDKTGEYVMDAEGVKEDYFRCAVPSDGDKKKEVTWEEHILTQITIQKWIDSGVSKTINFSSGTHRDTIAKSFMLAWKLGCKGITVYRNGSREVEVLTPKNVQKNLCPACEAPTKKFDGCTSCTVCEWSLCTV